jgi:hypothetical protein
MHSTNQLFKNLSSPNPRVKYSAQKAILELSYNNPRALYKNFIFFVDLLDNSNNIFVWTGLLVLGNLSVVDRDKKIDNLLGKIFSKLNTGKMITAGNAIKSLIIIGKSRPDLANNIAKELVKVERYKYDTEECKNILLGLIFASIFQIWGSLNAKSKNSLLELAKANTSNSRNATAKKAAIFLNKIILFN